MQDQDSRPSSRQTGHEDSASDEQAFRLSGGWMIFGLFAVVVGIGFGLLMSGAIFHH